MDESPITAVIQHYHPDWKPPKDRTEWNKTLCPFHDESNPSATVSYENNAFKCFGCGVKGGVINLIKRIEGVSYAQAVRRAEEILVGCDIPVQSEPAGKSGRRVFGESGPEPAGDKPVRTRVRGRSAPWS